MNTIFIGPGGVPRVVSAQSPGTSLQSQRVANSVGAGVSEAVRFASTQSKQSSPAVSDRVEDITDDPAQLARQAAAFAAQFMLPMPSNTPAETAAGSSLPVSQARAHVM